MKQPELAIIESSIKTECRLSLEQLAKLKSIKTTVCDILEKINSQASICKEKIKK
jgi:hypothetical protein